jgi:tubulysin polyketide synthase-like protein
LTVVSDEIETLISTFTKRGIKLIPDGDGLIVEPASNLTDADERTIRTWKPQLLDFLSRTSERNRWPERPRQPMAVRRCGTLIYRTCHVLSPSPHRENCAFPRFVRCRSRWYWLSLHGAVKCVACATPSDLGLVQAWVLARETDEGDDGWRIPGEILSLLYVMSPPQ